MRRRASYHRKAGCLKPIWRSQRPSGPDTLGGVSGNALSLDAVSNGGQLRNAVKYF